MPVLLKAWKAIRQPVRAVRYVTSVVRGATVWESRFEALRPPKRRGAVPHSPDVEEALVRELEASGFAISQQDIDIEDFRRFVARADYRRFPTYCAGGRSRDFVEKSLEHYLASRALGLQSDDVYIDVASYDSPAPRIYREIFGCTTYRQDIVFPTGVHGDRIGGDAGALPLQDGFASAMALHNAFEHFEGDSDTRFIREAGRVLSARGRLCIVPLFLFHTYAIQTDPSVWPPGGVDFDDDAVIYCERGWRNRHGRFYDVPRLVSRIRDHVGPLRMRIVVYRNTRRIDPGCYAKFLALFERAG